MAVTYSATPSGAYRSALRNALVSIAGGGTETITLVHGLGACPTEIRTSLRSIVASASRVVEQPVVTALNASQATILFGGAPAAAQGVTMDVICEVTTALVS